MVTPTRRTIGSGKGRVGARQLDRVVAGPDSNALPRNVIHTLHWFRRGPGEIAKNGSTRDRGGRWALGWDRCTALVTGPVVRPHFDDRLGSFSPTPRKPIFGSPAEKGDHWQGQSCNGLKLLPAARAPPFSATTGSVGWTPRRVTCIRLKNEVVKQIIATQAGDGLNISADDDMTTAHREFSGRDSSRCSASPTDREGRRVCSSATSQHRQCTVRALKERSREGRIQATSSMVIGTGSSAGWAQQSEPDRFFAPTPRYGASRARWTRGDAGVAVVSPHATLMSAATANAPLLSPRR